MMCEEVKLQERYLKGESISTIYFGGGTPSLLNQEEIQSLLDSIYKLFIVAAEAEITLEANPDDLTAASLRAFREMGVNRLSVGVQSFDDNVLKFFNRAHHSKSAIDCIGLAREAGFKNISLDLIYAVPGQGNEQWIHNIHQALALNPEHFSAYSLTIEEKTAFGKWVAAGRLKSVEDDVSAEQLNTLIDLLEDAGYEHYEVSNFSKPGFYSQHNSSYWRGKQYLGIGPSAHSYNLVSRQFNISNNRQYVRSLKEGNVPFALEVLSAHDHVNEYLMTALRTKWGCNLQKLKQEFQYNVLTVHESLISRLLTGGLAVIEHDHLKLTRPGKLMADKIAADLFLVP